MVFIVNLLVVIVGYSVNIESVSHADVLAAHEAEGLSGLWWRI